MGEANTIWISKRESRNQRQKLQSLYRHGEISYSELSASNEAYQNRLEEDKAKSISYSTKTEQLNPVESPFNSSYIPVEQRQSIALKESGEKFYTSSSGKIIGVESAKKQMSYAVIPQEQYRKEVAPEPKPVPNYLPEFTEGKAVSAPDKTKPFFDYMIKGEERVMQFRENLMEIPPFQYRYESYDTPLSRGIKKTLRYALFRLPTEGGISTVLLTSKAIRTSADYIFKYEPVTFDSYGLMSLNPKGLGSIIVAADVAAVEFGYQQLPQFKPTTVEGAVNLAFLGYGAFKIGEMKLSELKSSSVKGTTYRTSESTFAFASEGTVRGKPYKEFIITTDYGKTYSGTYNLGDTTGRLISKGETTQIKLYQNDKLIKVTEAPKLIFSRPSLIKSETSFMPVITATSEVGGINIYQQRTKLQASDFEIKSNVLMKDVFKTQYQERVTYNIRQFATGKFVRSTVYEGNVLKNINVESISPEFVFDTKPEYQPDVLEASRFKIAKKEFTETSLIAEPRSIALGESFTIGKGYREFTSNIKPMSKKASLISESDLFKDNKIYVTELAPKTNTFLNLERPAIFQIKNYNFNVKPMVSIRFNTTTKSDFNQNIKSSTKLNNQTKSLQPTSQFVSQEPFTAVRSNISQISKPKQAQVQSPKFEQTYKQISSSAFKISQPQALQNISIKQPLPIPKIIPFLNFESVKTTTKTPKRKLLSNKLSRMPNPSIKSIVGIKGWNSRVPLKSYNWKEARTGIISRPEVY